MPDVPAVIDAPADVEARAALRTITAQVQTLKGRAAAVLYELGTLLRRVEDEELWRAGGYAHFSDFLDRGVDIARSTARRAIDVTRHFNLDVAERYGFDKLARGLRYVEATGKVERPGDLIAADLRRRDARGRYFAVPFHEATGRQIDEATALVLKSRGARARKAPKDVAERVSRLTDALPEPVAGVRRRGPRVVVKENADGELSISFNDIPLAGMQTFVDAVEREMIEREG